MAIHRRAMKTWLGDVAEVVAPHHLERTELAAERALQPLQQLRDLVEARPRNERAVAAAGRFFEPPDHARDYAERAFAPDDHRPEALAGVFLPPAVSSPDPLPPGETP